jgi:hypothetical protein
MKSMGFHSQKCRDYGVSQSYVFFIGFEWTLVEPKKVWYFTDYGLWQPWVKID